MKRTLLTLLAGLVLAAPSWATELTRWTEAVPQLTLPNGATTPEPSQDEEEGECAHCGEALLPPIGEVPYEPPVASWSDEDDALPPSADYPPEPRPPLR